MAIGKFWNRIFLLKLICKFTFYADIKTIENYICNICEQAMRDSEIRLILKLQNATQNQTNLENYKCELQ